MSLSEGKQQDYVAMVGELGFRLKGREITETPHSQMIV